MSNFLLLTLALFAMALLLALLVISWREVITERKEVPPISDDDAPSITVIIPARNEEENIVAVLQDLFAQDYPRERMQVIVVDDEGSDGTADLVCGMMPQWPHLQLLESAGPGKKAAITTGVEAATGELVVLTDADVRCGPLRVRSIVAHWMMEKSDLIVLPVWTEGRGMLGRIQEDEQAALLGMAIGTAVQGRALMAYGANLAFSHAAFKGVGGYQGDRFASGDDHFLVQRMQRAGKHITAFYHKDVMVTAIAAPSFSAFLQQRLRWAGKMRGAGMAQATGFLAVLVFPWVLLWHTSRFNFVEGIGDHALFTLALLIGAWACWALPPILLVGDVRASAGRLANMPRGLFGLVAFSCYAPVIGIAALFARPKWKGRTLHPRQRS